jgi:hypothetical protein
VVLGIEPRTWCMVCKHWTTEVPPRSDACCFWFLSDPVCNHILLFSASQVPGITGISHHTQLWRLCSLYTFTVKPINLCFFVNDSLMDFVYCLLSYSGYFRFILPSSSDFTQAPSTSWWTVSSLHDFSQMPGSETTYLGYIITERPGHDGSWKAFPLISDSLSKC